TSETAHKPPQKIFTFVWVHKHVQSSLATWPKKAKFLQSTILIAHQLVLWAKFSHVFDYVIMCTDEWLVKSKIPLRFPVAQIEDDHLGAHFGGGGESYWI